MLLPLKSFPQEDAAKERFRLTGYLEVYYLYDLDKPDNHTRPSFMSSYNRSNEVNVNLGFIKGSYSTSRLRAYLAIMTGTYTNANMKNEPGVLRNIFEANTGVKLSATKEVWLDAGVFPSHIGFESAIGKDSWNLTRSVLADNSPYFETGARLSYTGSEEEWYLAAMVLNGWQRIQMLDGNTLPSFGTQLTYKPSARVTLNSSTFVGTDHPDSARLMRYFHNFYGIFTLSEVISLTVGFDNGWQERPGGRGFDKWFSPAVILRTNLSQRTSFDVRAEYYQDEANVIIKDSNAVGIAGLSVNLDYRVHTNALWRTEVRHFAGTGNLFPGGDNTFITTCIAVDF